MVRQSKTSVVVGGIVQYSVSISNQQKRSTLIYLVKFLAIRIGIFLGNISDLYHDVRRVYNVRGEQNGNGNNNHKINIKFNVPAM